MIAPPVHPDPTPALLPAIGFLVGAFLFGSIPFGLLIARAKGIDIRTVGSGNIGATNVGRALGRKWFIGVFLLDFFKGAIPLLAAGWWLRALGRLDIEPNVGSLWVGIGVAAVLGHVFTPWLRFKGGKGVATGAGVLMATFPALTVPALAAFVIFLPAVRLLRFMSLASMLAALSLAPFVAAWFHVAHINRLNGQEVEVRHMLPFLAFALLLGVLVFWTHRGNIKRLRAGTEPRWGETRPAE